MGGGGNASEPPHAQHPLTNAASGQSAAAVGDDSAAGGTTKSPGKKVGAMRGHALGKGTDATMGAPPRRRVAAARAAPCSGASRRDDGQALLLPLQACRNCSAVVGTEEAIPGGDMPPAGRTRRVAPDAARGDRRASSSGKPVVGRWVARCPAGAMALSDAVSLRCRSAPARNCHQGRHVSFEARKRGAVRLVPPLLEGMLPTVAFTERLQEGVARPYPAIGPGGSGADEPRLYVRLSGIASNGIKHAFRDAGFRRTQRQHFNALWTGALTGEEFHRLKLDRFQKVNHFPGTWELGRKDRLYRNVARLRRRQGAAHEFDIMPRSFMYPRDAAEWSADIARQESDGEKPLYIVKPPSSSRGRGIRVIKGPKDLPHIKPARRSGEDGSGGSGGSGKDVLVQRYLRRPHLINGFKYDLRVYVLVTSFDPLRVYLYEDGLVRFATEKYRTDDASLKKRAVHLTNYSINKSKANFIATASEEQDGEGSKWTIGALRRHFKENGIGDFDQLVWPQVKDLAIKCMLAVEAEVNTKINMHLGIDRNVCYELYGFDVVLDNTLRGWVLEANTGPALQAPGPLDRKIKHRMVADMLHLVGFCPYDREAHQRAEDARRRERLTGLGAASSRSERVGSASRSRVGSAGTARLAKQVEVNANGGERRKGWKQAEEMSFEGLALKDMPACIIDTEAEAARCPLDWTRIFPRNDTDARYRDLFEAQRYSNTVIARWLAWPGRNDCIRRARELQAANAAMLALAVAKGGA